MEYTLNRKSKMSLEDLNSQLVEERRIELEARHQKELERTRKIGFKTYEEMIDHLKSGKIIGQFFGYVGESEMDNDFLMWDKQRNMIARRHQMSDSDGITFWMGWKMYSEEEFRKWVRICEDHKNEEGYLPTMVFIKNELTAEEIEEFYKPL